jgi:uncharacterized OsmC-like protein
MSVHMKGRSTGPTTVELVHESGAVITTTAPKDNGGDGSSFSPTDLCAVSLGTCAVTIMSLYARNHGIALEGVSFDLEKEMTPPPRKIGRITIRFVLSGGFSDQDFAKIIAAGKTCPVRLTLGGNVEVVEEYLRG